MKKIGLSLLMFFFLFSGIAAGALVEGTWNTNQTGAMPGGDTLRNGEYHSDWYGDWPTGIDTEVVWASMGDSGAQWTMQGTRETATQGSGWSGVEGTDVYWYEPMATTYIGGGQLLFDGELYTGSGWTQDFTYTNKYLLMWNGSEWVVDEYVGVLPNMTLNGYGLFDGQPFEINWSMTVQQDTFNLTDTPPWDEGHSTYGEFTLSQIPIPGAFWLLASGLIGLVGIRRRLNK